MKRISKSCAASLLLVCSAACASVEPAPGFDLPVASKYVLRGLVVDKHAGLQPDLYYGGKSDSESFSLGAWGHIPVSSKTDGNGELFELDLYANAGRQVGPVWIATGLFHYQYPSSDIDSTTEVQLTVAYTAREVTAALETWYDFDEADGAYFNFNLSRGFALGADWNLGLLGSLGYMTSGQTNFNFGVDEAALSEWTMQATLSRSLTDTIGLSLVGAFASVIDNQVRDAVEDPDNLYVALGLAFGF